jgi:hypothetical protein
MRKVIHGQEDGVDVPGAAGGNFFENVWRACRECVSCSDLHMKAQKIARIQGGEVMKYILMMNTMRAGGHGLADWAKKDMQAHIAFMIDLNKELRESGELVSAEGLSFPDQARLVRADKDGMPITDGVFPESKEFLAGYWIVEVATPERAYAIAAKVSAAPGPGGAPLNMAIEVRPVMSGPPPEML